MATNRILYIEDNFQNRRFVRKLLTINGYEMIEAEDGLQGIAVAAREHPNLILMDINMPGMDGMEATSRLKCSPDLSHIPIIAVTAAAMKGDRERIIAAGCDDYLQKPIDNAKLIALICSYIGAGVVVPRMATLSKPQPPLPPQVSTLQTASTSPALGSDKIVMS